MKARSDLVFNHHGCLIKIVDDGKHWDAELLQGKKLLGYVFKIRTDGEAAFNAFLDECGAAIDKALEPPVVKPTSAGRIV